jgi:hypothetical protein
VFLRRQGRCLAWNTKPIRAAPRLNLGLPADTIQQTNDLLANGNEDRLLTPSSRQDSVSLRDIFG